MTDGLAPQARQELAQQQVARELAVYVSYHCRLCEQDIPGPALMHHLLTEHPKTEPYRVP